MAASVLLVAAGFATAPNAQAADLTGKVIVLDPGHGTSYASPLDTQVPNGRDGGLKACGTTGTSTDAGFPESTFTWDVVSKMRNDLVAQGATVVLTRDATGPVPCVDGRAKLANDAKPAVIVSIHGDGGPASGHGFHVNYSSPPLNAAQELAATSLAPTMRTALVDAGFTPATYLGSDGLYGRADLAGLNFAEYPAVLVELGNMRNADDAAMMTSDAGQDRYAAAVVNGIDRFLGG